MIIPPLVCPDEKKQVAYLDHFPCCCHTVVINLPIIEWLSDNK